MSKIKISYVSSEINPILSISSVGEFVKNLPIYMQKMGIDVRIFIPCFGAIGQRKSNIHQVNRLSNLDITFGDIVTRLIVKSTSLQNQKLQVYFIYGEEYFKSFNFFKDKDGNFLPENDKRAMFFCKGVLEALYLLDWSPDIIHCHDWITAFLPAMLKFVYSKTPIFQNTKSVFTIYNNKFNPKFASNIIKSMSIPNLQSDHIFENDTLSMHDILNLGIQYSDKTVAGENLDDDLKNLDWKDKMTVLENSKEGMDEYHKIYLSLLGK